MIAAHREARALVAGQYVQKPGMHRVAQAIHGRRGPARAGLIALAVLACAWLPGCGSANPAHDARPPAARSLSCALGGRDAAAALAACLDRAQPGTTVTLAPGRYVLDAPLRITRPVTIRTAGLTDASPRCGIASDARCATLALGARPPFAEAGRMPFEVRAPSVTLSHIRIVGLRGDAARDRATCLSARDRPGGGGLRVAAPRFALIGAAVRDAACYSAMEVTPGSDGLVVRDSTIGYNGNHDSHMMWSDGLTVHEGRRATITGNVFVDSTDVQLIFGGCTDCTVRGNAFRHDGPSSGSSFAELMLQSWPTTSGDFSGSAFTGNVIDCGPARRCGFGIMLGSNPWYSGRAFGGTVSGNTVRDAMMGLNIDGLTGAMTVEANAITASGGVFPAKCGRRRWPATNVAPTSQHWLRGNQTAIGNMATAGCILNQAPMP